MAPTFAHDVPDGCTLTIRLHPGARKNAVTGVHAEAVKIALTAPPVDGKANEALIAFLAETLHLPRARINIVAGLTSRSKTLRITGKSAAEVAAALFPTEICLIRYFTVSFAFGATVMDCPSVAVTFRFEAVTSA